MPSRGDVAAVVLYGRSMSAFYPVSCPYCGEASELDIDEGGASRQAYVQDCPVCCQPWQVDVARDRDGDWSAVLRTMDG